MKAILAVLAAFMFVVCMVVLKVAFAFAIAWLLVTAFGFVASLVGVALFAVYSKMIVVTVVAAILLIISLFN
ncbi:hypothetical protein [Bacillus thuringiensis]|uniref:hypothetical protein n=1 Tax=Bacillus thuringiensis TaxID=1428 RepID=UPI000BFBFC0E|nr:hypothetical protein [Bacillus thuringiensis]PGM50853.1 hypothetical protein CN949_16310 [Bacillus thuringiensis]PGZ29534.1 hypothetical protein COE50_22230 [Bacillus anthracis]